jgi:SH3-like domain-containing protein
MNISLLFLLLAVVAVVVVAFIFLRRRRSSDDASPIDISGDYVDYTSLPVEDEPKNWGERFEGLSERFANLPLPGKIAVFASPLLVIGLLVIGILVIQTLPGLGAGGGNRGPTTPPPPTPDISIETARLVSASSVFVEAQTINIPNGSTIEFEMLAGGQPFKWYNPISATVPISGTNVQFRLEKIPDAPVPSRDLTYTVRLRSTGQGGQEVERFAELEIPPVPQIRDSFFGEQAARRPTPVPPPTPTPTEPPIPTQTELPPPTEEPEPTEAAESPDEPLPGEPLPDETPQLDEPPPPQLVFANVSHGGNVRAVPDGELVVDQVEVGEEVILVEKQADELWYRVRTPRDIEGWVHYSLLDPESLDEVGAEVPVAGDTSPPPDTDEPPAEEPPAEEPPAEEPPATTGLSVSVANGGNVRQVPGGEPILDQINAFEIVELIKKLPDGSWYQIRNERDVVGWVHYSLLNQEELAAVADQILVEEQ